MLLLQLRLEFGGALSGLVGSGVRCVKIALQPVSPVAVLGGFRGGDVGERLEIGGGTGGRVGVLPELRLECGGPGPGLADLPVELLFEPVDLGAGFGGSSLGSASVVLCFVKLRLELGDTVAHACTRRQTCAGLIEFGLELLGPAAVLGGFGAGDVEERLEVGGGGGGGSVCRWSWASSAAARSSAAALAAALWVACWVSCPSCSVRRTISAVRSVA